MLSFNLNVFEDLVGSTTVYTGVQFARILGSCDQLAFQAMLERPSASPSLTLAIEESGDGVRWTQKNTTPEINGLSGTVLFGYDAGKVPTTGLVRLRMSLASGIGAPSAYLTVYVSARDQGRVAKLCACPDVRGKMREGVERRRDEQNPSPPPQKSEEPVQGLEESAGKGLEDLLSELWIYPAPPLSPAARQSFAAVLRDPKHAFPALKPEMRVELREVFKRLRAALEARAPRGRGIAEFAGILSAVRGNLD